MHVGTQVQVSESKKIIAAVGCWMDDFCVLLRVTGLHCGRGCWLATKVMLCPKKMLHSAALFHPSVLLLSHSDFIFKNIAGKASITLKTQLFLLILNEAFMLCCAGISHSRRPITSINGHTTQLGLTQFTLLTWLGSSFSCSNVSPTTAFPVLSKRYLKWRNLTPSFRFFSLQMLAPPWLGHVI